MAEHALPQGAAFGSYRILGQLVRGGMGVCYKARDARTGREVALKILPRAAALDEGSGERFDREGRLASSVRHPNVVALLEAGTHDGSSFLAFELVEAGSLEEGLRRRGRLPWREAA